MRKVIIALGLGAVMLFASYVFAADQNRDRTKYQTKTTYQTRIHDQTRTRDQQNSQTKDKTQTRERAKDGSCKTTK
jgi:choline-glycine betaine transporter